MKTIHYALALILALSFPSAAQTNQPPVNNFVLVTNLWYNGYKTSVLAIAEQRLAVNSNDLAGLIIRMEFNMATNHVNCFSNDILAVMAQLHDQTNHVNLRREIPFLLSDLQFSLDYLRTSFRPTQAEVLEDQAKFHVIHKPMIYEIPLKALHDDGLF